VTPVYLATGTSWLLDRICTSYPYCKLEDIKITSPASIIATFSPEAFNYYESGHQGVSTGELVRHMAIAGSVACALINPDKTRRHYYLAVGGSFYGTAFFEKNNGGEGAAIGGTSAAAVAGQRGLEEITMGAGTTAGRMFPRLPHHTVLSCVPKAAEILVSAYT
jgi:hypothetical protein